MRHSPRVPHVFPALSRNRPHDHPHDRPHDPPRFNECFQWLLVMDALK